ncbi:hypothetical protein [Nocardia beijingensis]
MNYAAEMERILADFTAASRTVLTRFLDADARTTRGGTELLSDLREQLSQRERESSQAAEEKTDREERDRLLREAAERKAARDRAPKRGKETFVLPSDWTEADEARAEGYGPPKSWLV